jgi:hypothetical protein
VKKQELSFIIIALLLGAVIGGLIGDIVGTYLPDGAAKTLFSKSIEIGFRSFDVDFYSIAFSFGLMIKINFMSILFVSLVIIYFRWWYL